MKCQQCARPALFLVTEQRIPLCLDCNSKLQAILERQQEDRERRMNYLVDQIELTVGIPGLGPRYPARNPPTVINQGGIRMNNITIDRSNIGVLNTGSIGAIDHAIGTMTSSGHDASADLFKAMTEAIAKNSEADVTLKNKLLELLSVLSSEATKPKEQRKNVAMLALVKEFASLCNGAATLVRALGQYLPALTGMFS